MFRKMYDGIVDNFEGFLAGVLVVLLVIVSLGLVFGAYVFVGWIVMLVYNVLAGAFSWPTFSIWFWTGVVFVINWLRKGCSIKINNNRDDD